MSPAPNVAATINRVKESLVFIGLAKLLMAVLACAPLGGSVWQSHGLLPREPLARADARPSAQSPVSSSWDELSALGMSLLRAVPAVYDTS
jgi:hypothetical protein